MADRNLNETFEAFGDWFLPEDPERKIAGHLNYTSDGTDLHLNESFQALRGIIGVGTQMKDYPVIYGITRDGEAMTLLKAQRMGVSLNFGVGGLRESERIHTSWLLVGAHMPPDFLYKEMSFRVPGLQIWLSQKSIEHSFAKELKSNSYSVTYVIRNMPTESIRLAAIDASIKFNYDWSTKCDEFTSIELNVSAWVTISPDEPQKMDWFIREESKITTMLSFIAGSTMSPDCIRTSINENHKVNFLITLRESKCCTYTNPNDFFMMKAGMGIGFKNVASSWFEEYPKLHMPSQLALSVLSSEHLWLHVKFLSYMQALEGFHRGLYEGTYMEDSQYQAVKSALCAAIPTGIEADHKASLTSRIRYGNQISLNKRLTELSKLLSEPIRTTILGSDGKIPRKWIDTRNYYTHWDEELKENVLDNQGMYDATVRMSHFLRALYLNLMKIPQESILKSLCNTSNYSQHLVQINLREQTPSNDRAGMIMSIQEIESGGSNSI